MHDEDEEDRRPPELRRERRAKLRWGKRISKAPERAKRVRKTSKLTPIVSQMIRDRRRDEKVGLYGPVPVGWVTAAFVAVVYRRPDVRWFMEQGWTERLWALIRGADLTSPQLSQLWARDRMARTVMEHYDLSVDARLAQQRTEDAVAKRTAQVADKHMKAAMHAAGFGVSNAEKTRLYGKRQVFHDYIKRRKNRAAGV